MSATLEQVKHSLLAPAGIEPAALQRLLGNMLSAQVDYADLYFQYTRYESWSLEEGQVKSGSHNIEQGVGVRAVSGEKAGFAYSDDIMLPALQDAAAAARAIARHGGKAQAPGVARQPGFAAHSARSLASPPVAPRCAYSIVSGQARRLDPRVKQVMANSPVHEAILVVRSDGRWQPTSAPGTPQ